MTIRLIVFWIGWALIEVASIKSVRAGLSSTWVVSFVETGYIVLGSIYLAVVKP